MKRKIRIIELIISSILNLNIFFFISCNSFTDGKFTDYLSNNSSIVKVVETKFSENYPLDSEQIISVPSESDVVIKYILQNPGQYKLVPTITNDADPNSLISSIAVPYTYLIDKNNNYISITLSKEILLALEKGGDVSPILNISAQDYSLEIPVYTTKIRANTPPLPVEDACVMVDKSYAVDKTINTEESIGKYILCFNLPKDYFNPQSIHSDISKIFISNVDSKYNDGVNVDITAGTVGWNIQDLPHSHPTTITHNSYNGVFASTFTDNSYSVYIPTTIYAKKNDGVSFTLTTEDNKGLQSSVNILSSSKKLRTVTSNIENDINVYNSEAEYFNMVLLAPSYTTEIPTLTVIDDVEIWYKIFDLTSGEKIIAEGSNKKIFQNRLLNGTYRIEAFARKDGFIDSDLAVWTFMTGEKIPVSITIELPESNKLVMSLSSQEVSLANFEDEKKLTLSAKVFDSSNVEIVSPEISEVRMRLFDRSVEYESDEVSVDPYSIILPSYIVKGNYTVVSSLKFDNCLYCCNFDILIVE